MLSHVRDRLVWIHTHTHTYIHTHTHTYIHTYTYHTYSHDRRIPMTCHISAFVCLSPQCARVCMYIYIYIYIYKHTTYTYTHTLVYIYIYIYIYAYIQTYMYVYIFIDINSYRYIHVNAHVYILKYAQKIHMYIKYTWMHTLLNHITLQYHRATQAGAPATAKCMVWVTILRT